MSAIRAKAAVGNSWAKLSATDPLRTCLIAAELPRARRRINCNNVNVAELSGLAEQLVFCRSKSGRVQEVDMKKPTSEHNAAEQQSKAAKPGGERLAGLIAFIVGFAILSLVSPINSFGSLLLILLGLVLMLVGIVLMIFGRWGQLFLGS